MTHDRIRGFTLIELMISLACIALIASIAMPYIDLVMQRHKEAELRVALREIRSALDAYHRATEEGRITRTAGDAGYPATLESLASGVQDATNPDGAMIYFLRRIPRDPFHADSTKDAAETWGKRSYASAPGSPREGKDVFDVYSRSTATGLNGVPYRDW
jgi:general secretion pathway protein G